MAKEFNAVLSCFPESAQEAWKTSEHNKDKERNPVTGKHERCSTSFRHLFTFAITCESTKTDYQLIKKILTNMSMEDLVGPYKSSKSQLRKDSLLILTMLYTSDEVILNKVMDYSPEEAFNVCRKEGDNIEWINCTDGALREGLSVETVVRVINHAWDNADYRALTGAKTTVRQPEVVSHYGEDNIVKIEAAIEKRKSHLEDLMWRMNKHLYSPPDARCGLKYAPKKIVYKAVGERGGMVGSFLKKFGFYGGMKPQPVVPGSTVTGGLKK